MVYSRLIALAGIGFLVSAGGCSTHERQGDASDEGDEALGTAEAAIVSMNKLSTNGLVLSAPTLRALSTQPLTMDGVRLRQPGLADTEQGRNLLVYIARCSLPEGADFRARRGNTIYVFRGKVGLAPQWAREALGQSGQRWITACLLAHANGHGDSVPISLRGKASPLQVTPQEQAEYPVPEGSYYGNIFNGGETHRRFRGLNACASTAILDLCPSRHFRPFRACALGASCAVNMTETCEEEFSHGGVPGGGVYGGDYPGGVGQGDVGQDDTGPDQFDQGDMGQGDMGQGDMGQGDIGQNNGGDHPIDVVIDGVDDQGKGEGQGQDQGEGEFDQGEPVGPSQWSGQQGPANFPGTPGQGGPGQGYDDFPGQGYPGRPGQGLGGYPGRPGQGLEGPGRPGQGHEGQGRPGQGGDQDDEVVTVYLKQSDFDRYYKSGCESNSGGPRR